MIIDSYYQVSADGALYTNNCYTPSEAIAKAKKLKERYGNAKVVKVTWETMKWEDN